jgi:hypothetical protein
MTHQTAHNMSCVDAPAHSLASSTVVDAPVIEEEEESRRDRKRIQKRENRRQRNTERREVDQVQCRQECRYFFAHGLRFIVPYEHTFYASAKTRWIGRTLVDVFTSEFVAYSRQHYEDAIRSGHIRVLPRVVQHQKNVAPLEPAERTITPIDYRIRDLDRVAHTLHRHEVPVSAAPINILYETPELVIVDKPASMPIHPCGKYRYNSLLYILEHDLGERLYSVHRLDRLTSGLVLLARSSAYCASFSKQLFSGRFTKQYIAYVHILSQNLISCSKMVSSSIQTGVSWASFLQSHSWWTRRSAPSIQHWAFAEWCCPILLIPAPMFALHAHCFVVSVCPPIVVVVWCCVSLSLVALISCACTCSGVVIQLSMIPTMVLTFQLLKLTFVSFIYFIDSHQVVHCDCPIAIDTRLPRQWPLRCPWNERSAATLCDTSQMKCSKMYICAAVPAMARKMPSATTARRSRRILTATAFDFRAPCRHVCNKKYVISTH